MIRTVPKKTMLVAVALTALLIVIYYSRGRDPSSPAPAAADRNRLASRGEMRRGPMPVSEEDEDDDDEYDYERSSTSAAAAAAPVVVPPHQSTKTKKRTKASSKTKAEMCPAKVPLRAAADMETVDIYPTLNFNADWIEMREYWNDKMQRRYERRRKEMWSKVPLRVFVMPHSHNDPGWLKTFEAYFHSATKHILDNIVDKLTKYKDMTFIWTEISFLSMWYETAHDARKANLQHLIEEGRFEILTGGWVMTDEASVDTFGMVDQLVEGHQWLRDHLNVTAKSSWSVDPFGHGGTFPYILKSSGVDGMVIMRIHYAWKEWFAREQQGDFLWHQQWDREGKHSILCHNFPYDIYSIKGSCGPHAQTCLEFNFKRVQGDYSEYTARYTPIHAGNVKERAELLLEQYGKTGSLVPHNVVLVPLGDDFTYNNEVEFDQQYSNYKMLMDFINQSDEYDGAQVSFGTLSDYFEEVRRRTSSFGTLNGDFFVYSDIFSEGRPAYWSGYYTTRPFMKKMVREVSAHLRSAEILFTWCYQWSRQKGDQQVSSALRSLYPALVRARRHLALFQHHDAITGTSKQAVMHDYALKLWEATGTARKVQRTAIQHLMQQQQKAAISKATVFNDFDRAAYQVPPSPLPLRLPPNSPSSTAVDGSAVLVFNPLAEPAREIISVFVEAGSGGLGDICARDAEGNEMEVQVNPTWNTAAHGVGQGGGSYRLDVSFLEVSFVAELPPLSINRIVVSRCEKREAERSERTKVYCLGCPENPNPRGLFSLSRKPEGAAQLENAELVLLFDEATHLLRSVTHKRSGRTEELGLEFAAYPTAQFQSGAYLFKTDPRGEDKVAVFGPDNLRECVITSGPVFSEVTLLFESGQSKQEPGTFSHTVRLYHSNDGLLNRGIYMENDFDFGGAENHNDVDLFMRFNTGIKNGADRDRPEFYTDMNGFQMQRRRLVRQVNIEGNYFPVSTMTYLEDQDARLTLVVDHGMGAAAWERGWLEVMVDRRSSFDDSRGMGEGVLDNRQTKHRYWLLYEPRDPADRHPGEEVLSLPSQAAAALSRRLNSPVVQYTGSSPRDFMPRRQMFGSDSDFPCDMHLLNLRTLSDPARPDEAPGDEALLILHSQGSDCALNPVPSCRRHANNTSAVPGGIAFSDLKVKKATRTLLTGVEEEEEEVGKKKAGRKKAKKRTRELRTDLSDLQVELMTLESVKLKF